MRETLKEYGWVITLDELHKVEWLKGTKDRLVKLTLGVNFYGTYITMVDLKTNRNFKPTKRVVQAIQSEHQGAQPLVY